MMKIQGKQETISYIKDFKDGSFLIIFQSGTIYIRILQHNTTLGVPLNHTEASLSAFEK